MEEVLRKVAMIPKLSDILMVELSGPLKTHWHFCVRLRTEYFGLGVNNPFSVSDVRGRNQVFLDEVATKVSCINFPPHRIGRFCLRGGCNVFVLLPP